MSVEKVSGQHCEKFASIWCWKMATYYKPICWIGHGLSFQILFWMVVPTLISWPKPLRFLVLYIAIISKWRQSWMWKFVWTLNFVLDIGIRKWAKQRSHCDYGPKKAAVLVLFFLLTFNLLFAPSFPCAPFKILFQKQITHVGCKCRQKENNTQWYMKGVKERSIISWTEYIFF